MKAETAINLVARYSALTRGIKDAKERIGDNMELCRGFSGQRGVTDEHGCWIRPRTEDEKGRDNDMHLWAWYQPEYMGDGYYSETQAVYQSVTAEEHGAECPHCYAAHLAIQERKAMRKSLGSVKAAMTRLGSQ